MENEEKVVMLGLDFEARELLQFVDDQVVASYREGYAAGKKAEQEKRAEFWLEVKHHCIELSWCVFWSCVFAVILILAERWQ